VYSLLAVSLNLQNKKEYKIDSSPKLSQTFKYPRQQFSFVQEHLCAEKENKTDIYSLEFSGTKIA
jgi:hypothetical protein